MLIKSNYLQDGRGSIVVRAHASLAKRPTARARLDALTERSLTVHTAANGYPVATLGR